MENYSASYRDEMHARYLELVSTDNPSTRPITEGARRYQQELIAKALNEYLAKCIQNNHRCAHCCFNHNGICFFAQECFENNQKYYKEEDEELE